jgi:hypothetical protein
MLLNPAIKPLVDSPESGLPEVRPLGIPDSGTACFQDFSSVGRLERPTSGRPGKRPGRLQRAAMRCNRPNFACATGTTPALKPVFQLLVLTPNSSHA